MKKRYFKLVFALLCLLNFQANAQWLPPVNFPSPTNVCDNTPWKLVFYDGFDGTTLNNSKWVKFNHWNGFESDDWGEGRVPYPGNHTVIQDENVVKKQFEEQIKTKPEYNWKLEENWYRIMERD